MHTFRLENEKGALVARDAFLLTFFCRQPAASVLAKLEEVYRWWDANTPKEAKAWCLIGETAETSKPLTPRALARIWSELDAKKASSREESYFVVGGPEKTNPAHRIVMSAPNDLDESNTSFVEIRFPSEAPLDDGVTRVIEAARFLGEALPFSAGYGSLALTCGGQVHELAFAKGTRGTVFRHPGFDVPRNNSVALWIGSQLAGAYWLTFVGPEALKKLGGHDALRGALDPRIQVEHIGGGVMLRAGERPEIGDVNRGDNLPLIRGMAKVLEPVLRTGDAALNNLFISEEERIRWERRHLD